MNRESAERAAALVQARYPGAEIAVSGMFGGARIDVRDGETFSLRLTIGGEDSPLLTAFGPDPEPDPEPTGLVTLLRLLCAATHVLAACRLRRLRPPPAGGAHPREKEHGGT